MPLPGLRGLPTLTVARRVISEIREDDCAGQAAQLAYYFLFSLFPLLLVLVTLIGYLPIANLFDRIMDMLGRLLPEQALSLVEDNVRSVATEQRGGLLSLGLVLALWSASAGFRAIMSSLDRAYDVEEGRPWWRYYGVSLVATLALSVLVVLAFALLVFGPQLGHGIAALVGLGGVFDTVWSIARWPAAIALIALVLAVVYYVAPDVEQAWRWVTPGSVVAVVGWIAASVGFSYYVQSFGSYNETYGSVGAVIVLLSWLYLTGFVLIVGGEVNAVVEHLALSGKRPGEKANGEAAAAGGRPRGEGDRRGLAFVRTGGAPAAAPPSAPAEERRRGERRRGERRRGERRRGEAAHLTLVRRPAPAPVRPDEPEAYDEARPAPYELLRELPREARRLVALEARLALAGLRAARRRLAAGGGLLLGGLAVAAVGLLFVVGAVVGLLAGAVPPWLAALLASAVLLVAAGAAVRAGRDGVRARVAGEPRRAAAAVRTEVRWLRGLLGGRREPD